MIFDIVLGVLSAGSVVSFLPVLLDIIAKVRQENRERKTGPLLALPVQSSAHVKELENQRERLIEELQKVSRQLEESGRTRQ